MQVATIAFFLPSPSHLISAEGTESAVVVFQDASRVIEFENGIGEIYVHILTDNGQFYF